jgi:hypothetical protein
MGSLHKHACTPGGPRITHSLVPRELPLAVACVDEVPELLRVFEKQSRLGSAPAAGELTNDANSAAPC